MARILTIRSGTARWFCRFKRIRSRIQYSAPSLRYEIISMPNAEMRQQGWLVDVNLRQPARTQSFSKRWRAQDGLAGPAIDAFLIQ